MMRKSGSLYLILVGFAALVVWLQIRMPALSDTGNLPWILVNKVPFAGLGFRPILIVTGTLFALAVAALLVFWWKILRTSAEQSDGPKRAKASAAVASLLFLFCSGFALWAYGHLPFLWSHGLYFSGIALAALGLCGALYGLSVAPLWKAADSAPRSRLFLGASGVLLCAIVAVGLLIPTMRVVRNPTDGRESQVALKPPDSSGAPSQPVRILIFGDPGHRPDHARATSRRADRFIGDQPLSAVVLMGDNLSGDPDPFPAEMKNRIERPFDNLLERRVPFFTILGNHDTAVPEWAEGELQSPLLGMNGRSYYSETFGNNLLTIFFLCSEGFWYNPGQVAWFSRQMKSCTSQWKIVCIHRPLWGGGENEEADRALSGLMMRLMRRGNDRSKGVDVVFSGHHHAYIRRALKDNIQHIVLGNSSNSLDKPSTPVPECRTSYWDRRCFGFLEASPDQIRFEAVTDKGAVVDKFLLQHEGLARKLRIIEQPAGANISLKNKSLSR